ncbi:MULTISPECIES: LPS translocon maturation chaperone LptM [Marinobacter]|uniref:Lipoprotein-attachment site-containing protein n=1 Tax=Marinobacter segnicrescens TaxID=430453 RepID=A0A1I0FFC2_9GAMM|nr:MULTISPECIES: lipoprotein [Marinobacter]UZD65209.1 lipoprotein [Marinobacter sp. AN1]SET56081.1 lipoprotein-attachment site-containing protein [Marinobacter segnicrescens]
MPRTAICLVVMALLAGLSAGCGQKGPLERPPAEPAAIESRAGGDTENR